MIRKKKKKRNREYMYKKFYSLTAMLKMTQSARMSSSDIMDAYIVHVRMYA